MITFVLGGSRSGKSALAERLVLAHPGPLAYLATGVATDPDMAARIEAHRARRDPRFITIVAGSDLALAIRLAPSVPMLVDALGTWVASHPEFAAEAADGRPADEAGVPAEDRAEAAERAGSWAPASLADRWAPRLDEVLAALAERSASTVLVSDEVGLGVHPETEAGRRFRDALGLVNQRIAAAADVALLVVAGRVLRLDPATEVLDELAATQRTPGAEPELDLRVTGPPSDGSAGSAGPGDAAGAAGATADPRAAGASRSPAGGSPDGRV